jgi:hypothetical protein
MTLSLAETLEAHQVEVDSLYYQIAQLQTDLGIAKAELLKAQLVIGLFFNGHQVPSVDLGDEVAQS